MPKANKFKKINAGRNSKSNSGGTNETEAEPASTGGAGNNGAYTLH